MGRGRFWVGGTQEQLLELPREAEREKGGEKEREKGINPIHVSGLPGGVNSLQMLRLLRSNSSANKPQKPHFWVVFTQKNFFLGGLHLFILTPHSWGDPRPGGGWRIFGSPHKFFGHSPNFLA